MTGGGEEEEEAWMERESDERYIYSKLAPKKQRLPYFCPESERDTMSKI
jgi:hypothetical protein